MKKLLVWLLAAVMCLSMATVAFADEAVTEEPMLGAWEINTDIATQLIDDLTTEIFTTAVETLVGVDYVPVAVLGVQVVNGMNIAYLATATAVTPEATTKLVVVIINYSTESGETSIVNIADFDLGAFAGAEATTAAAEVTFTLRAENSVTGEVLDEVEVTTDCATLGEYMRTLESVTWEDSAYGIFVTAIGDIANDDETSSYWSYYIDGEYAMVGADECTLTDGMVITWAYESYSYDAE